MVWTAECGFKQRPLRQCTCECRSQRLVGRTESLPFSMSTKISFAEMSRCFYAQLAWASLWLSLVILSFVLQSLQETLLHEAASAGDVEFMRRLLDMKADVTIRDRASEAVVARLFFFVLRFLLSCYLFVLSFCVCVFVCSGP